MQTNSEIIQFVIGADILYKNYVYFLLYRTKDLTRI